jgi:DNA-binding transcriptional LysR family regulator
MRSLNLDQLRALAEVADLGSFSAAARRLNLTQPAVSLQIRELEIRFGLALIERMGKRASPTAAGRALIEHGRRMMTEADRALAAMRRHKDGRIGRVHIGTGVTALTYLLPPLLRRLRADYPDIELVITTGTTDSVVERMLANAIDLGFVTLPVDARVFTVTPIRRDPLLAILPAGGNKPPAAITPAELARRPLIFEYGRSNHTRMTQNWMRAAGLDARPVMEIDNIEAIKPLVAAGLGASVIPSAAIKNRRAIPGVIVRPLKPPLARTLALIQRRDKPDDPALRAVRDAFMTLKRHRARAA